MGPKFFMSFLRTAADCLAACLSPPRCRGCHTPLFNHANPYLCPSCAAGIDWIGDGACRGCGYPAGPHAEHGDDCHRCRGKKPRLTTAAAVARYRNAARDLVLRLKFRGETEIAGPMAGLMAKRLGRRDFPAIDLVLPVALHPSRRRQRGFDQAALLAEHVGRLLGLPADAGLLRRTRPTTPQATLHRSARLINMQGAFSASPETAGKSVLLIDDVMTTGSTMAECARACREAGARRVSALVFAR